ncbi:hypothetical protein THRCLA_22227 [Thraustotheca clavata]|uniref:Protein kinase domain-containing protein n=1 Tax=Thraustotheca clavata TaxID=74557 RepID=A0A1V9Z9D1_9STRA|nr:hypothetical protein THRCLA_22227 [Thraustotheca clavata]
MTAKDAQEVQRKDVTLNYEDAIGFGGYATVYKIVVAKKPHPGKSLDIEIDMVQKCKSPYVLRAIAIARDSNLQNPWLVFEYMEG